MSKSKGTEAITPIYPGVNPRYDAVTGEVAMFNGRPHLRPVVDASKGGRTKSEFARSCDLKERVRVYQERGVLPGGRPPAGPENFLDMTMYPESYHDALNLVSRVTAHFASLPSEVRTKFHNDPQLYLADMEQRLAANKKAAAEAAGLRAEAEQYDLEASVASGRRKAAEKKKRVDEALKEPENPPAKQED